jgi:tetratricopeptide (TPR) repeat protein
METTEKTIHTSEIYDKAVLAIQKGKYEEALHQLNTFLLFDPEHIDASLKKGLCYLYLNKTEMAAHIFDDIRESHPNHPHVYACIAELFKLQYEFDIAIDFCDKAIRLTKDDASDYNLMLSELFFYKHDFDTAFTYINKAIVQCPHSEYCYYWRALILNRFEKYDAAVNDLNKAIALYPEFSDAYRQRASVLIKLNQVDAALKDIKIAQYIEMDEENELQQHLAVL